MIFPKLKPHKCFRREVVLGPEQRRAGTIPAEEPGVFRCTVRKIGSDPEMEPFEKKQNYAARPAGNDDLALEAELFLRSDDHPDWKNLRIGIPLSEVPEITRFTILYTGAKFQLIGGGRVLDEEYPYGEPPGDPACPAAPEPEPCPEPVIRVESLHGWSPEGLNVWVGDVSTGFFNGEFHIFYLYDRRHHGSRFLCGAHQWAHLATADFKNFRDNGVILPIRDQWQSFGTGTPFRLGKRTALAYGLHSGRMVKPGEVPRGMTWAESSDGIRFEPSRISLDDFTENPSVYDQPDGSWIVYNRGVLWRAERWPEFQPAARKAIPCEERSALFNSYECPSLFKWHGWYFMLVGFTGMYRSRTAAFEEFDDLAGNGLDVYDGLKVPMVAQASGGRMILAGWVSISGSWGGLLGIRELVWSDDAVPGIRWLDEAMPRVTDLKTAASETVFPGSGYFEFAMEPGRNLRVCFSGSGVPVELRIDAKRGRAEIASEKECPTLCELGRNWRKASPPGFAADHLRRIDRPYTVRVMIRDERKWNGCLADVEIAGFRTMIHHFPGSHPTLCRIAEGPAEFQYGRIMESEKPEETGK